MFVEELNKELVGRMLAIWLGTNEDGTPFTDLPLDTIEAYRARWRSEVTPKKINIRDMTPEQLRRAKRCGCGDHKT